MKLRSARSCGRIVLLLLKAVAILALLSGYCHGQSQAPMKPAGVTTDTSMNDHVPIHTATDAKASTAADASSYYHFLEEKFPQLQGKITGGNYPPPQNAIIAQQIVAYIQYATIALLLIGDSLFSYLPSFLLGPNRSPPSWYLSIKNENPMLALSFIFLVFPTFANSMATTGAFEIVLHYGDGTSEEQMQTLFSRIATGHFPNGAELIEGLKQFGLKMA